MFPASQNNLKLAFFFFFRDLGSGSSLSFSRLFYDEHWSKHRVVTCLDWSPQVSSTFLRRSLSGRMLNQLFLITAAFYIDISLPLNSPASILSCSSPRITTTKMLHMNRMVLLLCGTSNLRRRHQNTSFIVRYLLPLHMVSPIV